MRAKRATSAPIIATLPAPTADPRKNAGATATTAKTSMMGRALTGADPPGAAVLTRSPSVRSASPAARVSQR